MDFRSRLLFTVKFFQIQALDLIQNLSKIGAWALHEAFL